MTDGKRNDDAALEMLFEAGRSHAPVPDNSFLSRIAADAEHAVPQAQESKFTQPDVHFFARFKGLFAASGLSGIAALGLWVGFIMPDIVTDMSLLSESGTTLSAFLPGSDLSVLSE